ncbi:hybrid sensor histidine kinase/response regulator [Dyella nitratireducens]|uniref:histidine kinase n=1 Tax=Dyella nitratireducens TaxID=1849580 RepID=A0ABQ1G7H7_9GAMM|nr:hybrid sensor histidine kinase/response regulator [Dyella nitratireducens]GGA38235.1 sensor histidine kinase [Dyella nitratireducens]GLQ40279.1 sensor histidine kinase [Dyella nitratireducens]
MPTPHPKTLKTLLLMAVIAAIGTSTWAVAWYAKQHALAQLSEQALNQLQIRALALQRLVDRYRVLPTVLALDPELRDAVSEPASIHVDALNRKLTVANGATHVSTLTLINRHGVAIAASNWNEPSSNVGLDYAFRPYFQQAMQHDVGKFYGIGISTNLPGYFISEALHDDQGQRIGVIVIKIPLDTLEKEWVSSGDTVLLSDANDVVFLSNQPAWIYRPLTSLGPSVESTLARTRQYGNSLLPPASLRTLSALASGGHLVHVDQPGLSHDVVWQSISLPSQQWTLHLLCDAYPATLAAYRAAILALSIWLVAILLALFLQQRVRAAQLHQRSRRDLERLISHYASALRSEEDSLVHAALQAMAGHPEMLERLPQGVSVIDTQLRLIAWNARYAELFGYPDSLLKAGQPVEELFRYNAKRGLLGPGDIDDAIQRRLNYLRQGSPHMVERERPDGVLLEIRGRPLPGGGFVTSYADIALYKEAARELRTLTHTLEHRIETSTQDLRAAKAEAERANRNKTRYVAAAVHDLLQPLNAARLFAGSLKQSDATDAGVVERIERSLQALDSQLTSMLDLARLDAGAITPELKVFALSPLLQELAGQFGIMAQAKGLQLSFVNTSAWVRSNPALLQRAVQNFLSNALHYTPQGRILLGCRRIGQAIRIEVWDTGIGIPEDRLDIIFQEFRRLDTAVDADERSAGLGLSIVERIAHLLDHPLLVRSSPGRGSVFGITVALAQPPQHAAQMRDDDSSDSLLKNRTIWLVQENAHLRQKTATMLQAWGCQVFEWARADEAITATSSPAPDLILVDGQWEPILALMKLASSGRQTPIVAFLGKEEASLRDVLRQAGVHTTNLPLSPARLRAMMMQLLLGS